jgi:hypothetical protein
MSKSEPEFPIPIRMNGRLFWQRSKLEAYKHQLISNAIGSESAPADKTGLAVESFVSSEQVMKEFGFGRRTLGRRIAGHSIQNALANGRSNSEAA